MPPACRVQSQIGKIVTCFGRLDTGTHHVSRFVHIHSDIDAYRSVNRFAGLSRNVGQHLVRWGRRGANALWRLRMNQVRLHRTRPNRTGRNRRNGVVIAAPQPCHGRRRGKHGCQRYGHPHQRARTCPGPRRRRDRSLEISQNLAGRPAIVRGRLQAVAGDLLKRLRESRGALLPPGQRCAQHCAERPDVGCR